MDLDRLPGFRRRFHITPTATEVTAAVEDDYHCMAVTLRHDGKTVTAVEAVMDRWPWTTCPGARDVLATTFVGVMLTDIAARGSKRANCTHLYDLAVLAGAHALDAHPLRYDILTSDPVDGLTVSEIRRDGVAVLRLEHRKDIIETPDAIRGQSLFELRRWIESLADGGDREAARLLQWGTILAHGRSYPIDRQSDAKKYPPNCYTFQPENVGDATRIGKIFDFNAGREPLAHFDGRKFIQTTEQGARP